MVPIESSLIGFDTKRNSDLAPSDSVSSPVRSVSGKATRRNGASGPRRAKSTPASELSRDLDDSFENPFSSLDKKQLRSTNELASVARNTGAQPISIKEEVSDLSHGLYRKSYSSNGADTNAHLINHEVQDSKDNSFDSQEQPIIYKQMGYYWPEPPKVDFISSEVSLDNVVEGSRRKRARFTSAQLPLTPNLSYTPNSSLSFTAGSNGKYFQPLINTEGLPTPATLSAISDEDVAMQLIRLGGNSPSVRESVFSTAGSSYSPDIDSLADEQQYDEGESTLSQKKQRRQQQQQQTKSQQERRNGTTNGLFAISEQGAMGPPDSQQYQQPSDGRPYTGARCTRCKKTKKGCDRKRPCQRCVEAGLQAWECIGEEEVSKSRNVKKRKGAQPSKIAPRSVQNHIQSQSNNHVYNAAAGLSQMANGAL